MAKTKTSWAKGQGGRKKGVINESTKVLKTVKETVLNVFNDLQSDPRANLKTWAKENTTEFYRIAAKLIPTDIKGSLDIKQEIETTITYEVLPPTE